MLIGYARVSTQDQNLSLQRDALRAASCRRIFTDKKSGATIDRPGLAKAIASMKSGDTLVIWKLSRLGRSLRQLISTVQLLADKNVELRSLHECIDTATATGKLLFHIIAAFAQFERDNMIENTMAGLAAARARGRRGGRKPKMNEDRLSEAYAMCAAYPDMSPRELREKLGISKATYYRYRLYECYPANDSRPTSFPAG